MQTAHTDIFVVVYTFLGGERRNDFFGILADCY